SDKVAFLHVLIHSSDSVLFEGQKKVLVKPQKNIILVETDKAFYKPGEMVKFRIINLDDDLVVIKNECLQIWLQDPEYNCIAEWMNVKSRHGIVDLSFPLASEAVLGEYTIFMQQDMAQKKFSVKEYELTKIELKIEHPPFISTEDKEFQLKLCGKYTYGRPAQGKIDITFITLLQFEMNDFSNSSEMRKQQSWTDKNGCANFTVKTKALELNESESSIIVIGEMEEAGTGAQTKDLSEISIVTRMKSIEFVNIHPFYKRGLPYSGQMFCHSGDSPLQNEMVYLTVDVDDEKTYLSFLTDEEVKVHFSLHTTNWNTSLVYLMGTYYLRNDTNNNYGQNTGIGESFHWLKPFYSESNSFLEIKARNDVMPCDQEQDVRVDYILDQNKLSSEIDHVDFYYMNLGPSMALLFALQVIAKGRILFSGEKQVPVLQHENLHGSFSLTLTIGNDFLLDIKLLVYTLFLDGEVVADVEEFQVAKCFRHKVELDFSSKPEVPGSKVSLNLKAAPGSFCSVQSVDKRVLLMKNNILTADTLYKKVFDDSFTIGGRRFPYHLEDFDAYPCLPQQSSLLKKAQMGAPWYQNSHVVHANLAPQSDDTKKPKQRTHFPETWIWDLVPVSDDGQASLQVTVPDTITEWNANTFCVANTGFGLSHLTTLRVFQPFFVDLSLPYSVTQGEIFSLKATVFNYLKDCVQVHTTLIETPELKVDSCPGCQFTSCLCANEAKTFVWNVTAIRLGKVNVTVSSVAEESHNLCDNRVAVTPLQGETDTVIKPLLVKPGGILQEKTQNAFLCATDFWVFLSSDNTVLEEFSLILPAETLEGSGQATFSVIGDKGFPCSWKSHYFILLNTLLFPALPPQILGDIMGPALQNLDQLLEMPFGCGEQNMVLFAPNIFILQYLKKTKQLDPEIEATALYFLRTGYQRQLLYKHDDGSYSAFGKSDTQGNTWLTAFVARSFGQASSYIYINKDHVQDAVLWLQKHQLSNGCFQSVGKLFNNDLKGGVNDTLSLTAYIAAALLELQLEKNDTVVSLQALAQYAALIPHEIRDVKVTVKGKEASPLEFHVHKNNKLVLHQASLLEIPGMYKVEATGRGCVYVQSTLYYNTLPPKTEVVFLLDVETVTRECDGIRKQFDIHVSVSYTGDRVTSNMALLQVDMLSGFIPIKKSVKELENVLLVKKTEIKPDKVIVYLEELDKTSLKLLISVEQDNEVQNLKPATVHVYDYYKPGEISLE
ncbi:hypothetical protein ASZ78_002123, partial [Callipepla squamata]